MRLTIFSRLIIGYMAIFVLAMAVSVYAIAQLRQHEKVTESILVVDNRMREYEKRLSDTLLSMVRYEKKFFITKDEGLFERFRQFSSDFEDILEEAASLADTGDASDLVKSLKQGYSAYLELVGEELERIAGEVRYDEKKFADAKGNEVDKIMNALIQLKNHSRRSTYDKVRKLAEAEKAAGGVAVVMGIAALFSGILISVFITVSITRPLSAIKKKTRRIAEGDFENDLVLSSPPEIAELAQAFNNMCSRLNELDRMKSDFFSLMSHELRTPLTTIREGVSLLVEGFGEGPVKEREKKLLNIIHEESMRLINLVNSIMDFSKLEAGMMVYNYTSTDILPLVRKVIRELEPLAENRRINVRIEAAEYLPDVTMDTECILRVLRNLVGNAVKFTPNGGRVSVTAKKAGEGVLVSVADSGPGISKEKIDLIFNKYQRAALRDSEDIIGSGLGLFMVRQIIIAHGGKVWAESKPGQGSAFYFVLPS